MRFYLLLVSVYAGPRCTTKKEHGAKYDHCSARVECLPKKERDSLLANLKRPQLTPLTNTSSVAICIAGQTRTLALAYQNIYERIVKPLQNPDIFFNLDPCDRYMKNNYIEQGHLEASVTRLLKPISFEWSFHRMPRHSPQSAALKGCLDMIIRAEGERKLQYTWIIRLRPDVSYTNTLDTKAFLHSALNPTGVVLTDSLSRCSRNDCISDVFGIVARDAARAYFQGDVVLKEKHSINRSLPIKKQPDVIYNYERKSNCVECKFTHSLLTNTHLKYLCAINVQPHLLTPNSNALVLKKNSNYTPETSNLARITTCYDDNILHDKNRHQLQRASSLQQQHSLASPNSALQKVHTSVGDIPKAKRTVAHQPHHRKTKISSKSIPSSRQPTPTVKVRAAANHRQRRPPAQKKPPITREKRPGLKMKPWSRTKIS